MITEEEEVGTGRQILSLCMSDNNFIILRIQRKHQQVSEDISGFQLGLMELSKLPRLIYPQPASISRSVFLLLLQLPFSIFILYYANPALARLIPLQ